MATHILHSRKACFYFITFTCHKWLPLFRITKLEDYFFIWLDRLNKKGILTSAYVLMPNHLHLLVYLDENGPDLNKTVGEAKRFMAYEIIKRLKLNRNLTVLKKLKNAVSLNEQFKGKIHQVFIPSFDAKAVEDDDYLNTVAEYIHHNPVKGKWRLIDDFAYYPYSSAGYYYLRNENKLILVDFRYNKK